MKHYLKVGVVLAAAAVVAAAGIFAAVSFSHKSSSTVSFTSSSAYVDITGTASLGETREYAGATYKDFTAQGAQEQADEWALGELIFDETHYTAVIAFTFTNVGDMPVKVAVTAPTLPDSFAVLQKVQTGAETTTAMSVTLGYEESATYTYAITLTTFAEKVGATDCSFTVNFGKAE